MMDGDGHPPDRIDGLWFIRAALGNVERRVSRAGADGTLDPTWAARIRAAIDHAQQLCLLARVDGAALRVRLEPDGASVQVQGTVPQPLPTEAAHARDDASWVGQR